MSLPENPPGLGEAEEKALTSYRLGRVERVLEEVLNSLKELKEADQTLKLHELRITSLEKSRDRLITATATLATAFIMMVIDRVSGVFG